MPLDFACDVRSRADRSLTCGPEAGTKRPDRQPRPSPPRMRGASGRRQPRRPNLRPTSHRRVRRSTSRLTDALPGTRRGVRPPEPNSSIRRQRRSARTKSRVDATAPPVPHCSRGKAAISLADERARSSPPPPLCSPGEELSRQIALFLRRFLCEFSAPIAAERRSPGAFSDLLDGQSLVDAFRRASVAMLICASQDTSRSWETNRVATSSCDSTVSSTPSRGRSPS